MKLEVKDELTTNDEFSSKVKLEIPIKDEKLKIKNELGIPIKREVKKELLSDEDFLADRVPHWNKMCIDFQNANRPWTPTHPCCLPNGFLLVRTPPWKKKKIPCYMRLEEEGRRVLRHFVEDEDLLWF